ncbi:FUSC family protein [Clostridium guangxiense]|uniref:FUSC family protein n=1 Tax=Clostridium guangxiense TaxID=1662055 RepID=UPI001E37982E|nr:aromatic acid exporter family protein [Clostridium guangxiense]MCD2345935.1 aromatic acid exporter family protein [Clostridium guangxiense]
MKPIGMRNIKTALSVFLCVLVSRLLKMEYPFYAAIAAVISMSSSVTDSYIAGRNRMFGTFVGAMIGLLFSLVLPGNILLCGVGIIIIIYICNILNWNKSISIACIVFTAIMTNLNGRNPFSYSFNRLLDTLLGITIALAVNYIFIPPKYVGKIIHQCNTVIDHLFIIFGKNTIYNEEINLKEYSDKLNKLENYITTYSKEIRFSKETAIKIDNIKSMITQFNKAYYSLNILNSLKHSKNLNKDNAAKIEAIFNKKVPSHEGTYTDELIVYNYHVGELLNILESLIEHNITKDEFIMKI